MNEGHDVYLAAQYVADAPRNTLIIANNKHDLHVIRDNLEFFLPGRSIIVFSSWDCLPYERTSPSCDITASRLIALRDIIANCGAIIVSNQYALAQKLPPKHMLSEFFLEMTAGVTQRDNILNFLHQTGYYASTVANNAGEFAERASLIDVISGVDAWRLTFNYEILESIKRFDPNTQGSLTAAKLTKVTICASSELIGKARQGNICQGMERHLVDLYGSSSTILDYCDDPKLIATSHDIDDFIYCRMKSAIEPASLYMPINHMDDILSQSALKHHGQHISIGPVTNFYMQAVASRLDNVFNLICAATQTSGNKKILICCGTEGSCARVMRALKANDIDYLIISNVNEAMFKIINLGVLNIKSGFATEDHYFISENEIFGKSTVNKCGRKKSQFLLSAFNTGDIVVHEDYGIGKFAGLQNIAMGGKVRDFITIIYADNSKLLIPAENINLITKYGQGTDASLDRLGGVSWQNRKARIKSLISEVSKELLVVAAKRQQTHIAPIICDNDEKFCLDFPYVETEDQLKAIADITSDLASGRPMDRLICGEAGFGKTEVAIRATFAVTHSNDGAYNQVAVLTPSTLLCAQHTATFKERLEKFGCTVAQLSRLNNNKENARIIEKLSKGEINVIIGTHALLKSDIRFKNLKMLIIDEEQAFGVKHKEKLKGEGVHVLSLSATPIPRTLYMALAGIKDLSVIATPPIEKVAVDTIITEYDDQVIFNAISREINRRGQVFYVVPKIQHMNQVMQKLTDLFPGLRIRIAHGQMPVVELESAMREFYEGRCDILISTTIVESGLNILNANTIIIENVQYLGISQLCQLRGRVGRHKTKGYAYIILPTHLSNEEKVKHRIAIMKHVNSGFTIASHDMDTRGFGNILGSEQSGTVKEVGIELYQRMLEEEIENVQANAPPRISPDVNLGLSVSISKEYVEDDDMRLLLYRKATEIMDIQQLEEFAVELVDRFGPMPENTSNLILTLKYKVICKNALVIKLHVDSNSNEARIALLNNTFPKASELFAFIQQSNGFIKANPKQELEVKNAKLWLDKLLEKMSSLVCG